MSQTMPSAMNAPVRATSFATQPRTPSAFQSRPAPVIKSFRAQKIAPVKAIELDWSDPDTLTGLAGVVVGLAAGVAIPAFLISRDERDEERVEEIRELNRAYKEETGEYMSSDEIQEMRPRRWTDRREFADDD